MHRMTVHFNDGRTPVVLPAGNFDLRTAESARDGAGLQRYSVITPEGEEVPIFLDPASIAAVTPALSNAEKGFRVRPRDPITTTSPVTGQDPEHTVIRFLCRFVAAKPRQLEKMLGVEARRAERLSPNRKEMSRTATP